MNKLNDGSDFLERIDAVCAGFAQALRSTSNDMTAVSIESLLSRHSDLPRQELLRELLREELEYLQNRGQHPSADDLQRRFPHDSDIIAEVLSSAQVGAGVPGNDRTLPADPGQLADSGPQAANTHGSRDEWKPQIEGFQLFEQLGKGGMGVVYRAIDHHRRQVALKVLPHDRLTDRRAQERFNNEIYALGRLRHQNIVQVHESGHRNGEYFYSMDYIRGQNLAALIRAASDQIGVRKAGASAVTPPIAGLSTHQTQPSGSGPKVDTGSGSNPPLPEGAIVYPSSDFLQSFIGRRPAAENRRATAAVVQIGIDVAEALHYAHESGVTHRDLKPANLLLDVTGRVWVADFGLAQVDDGAALTMEGEVLGTWRYMSPEQLMGGRVIVDSLTDIYSLGVTLYELLSLQPARDGKDRGEVRNQVAFGDAVPLRQRNPAVPRDLETIVHRAMAYRPKDRYQTMQELAADLRRFERREPILAKPAGPLKRFSLWVEREQKLAASLAASAALLLIILGLLLAFINKERVYAKQSAAAESEAKQKAQQQAKEAEAGRLTAWSHERRNDDPTLAILLGLESYYTLPTAEALTATIMALYQSQEIRSWQPRQNSALESRLVASPHRKAIVLANYLQQSATPLQAIESDTDTGLITNAFGDGQTVVNAEYSQDGNWLLTLEISPEPSPLATFRVGPASNPSVRVSIHSAPLSDLPLNNGIPDAPAAFLSNSSQLLISDSKDSIKLYDLQRLNEQLHPESLQAYKAFTSITSNESDGTFSAVTVDGHLLLFSTPTQQPKWDIPLPFATTPDAPGQILHHDSSIIITTSNDGLHFFSAIDGSLKHNITNASQIVAAPQANLAVTFGKTFDCGLLDLSSLKTLRRLRFDESVVNAAVSPHGDYIALAGDKHFCVLKRSGQPNGPAVPRSLIDMLFMPDGTLLSLQPDGVISRWSMTSLFNHFSFPNSDAATQSTGLSCNPEGTHVVYAANPETVTCLLDLTRHKQIFLPGTSGRASPFVNSVFTAENRTIHLWDLQNGIKRLLRSWQAPESISLIQQTEQGHAFALTTDGQLLSADSNQQGATLERIVPQTVSGIRFAPSVGLTIIGTSDGHVYCNHGGRQHITSVTEHDRPITAVCVDHSTKTIAAADDRGAFAIWKVGDTDESHIHRPWSQSPLSRITAMHFHRQTQQLYLVGVAREPMVASVQLSAGSIDSTTIEDEILHSAVSQTSAGLFIATKSGLRHWVPGQPCAQISKKPTHCVACTNSEVVTSESESAKPLPTLRPSQRPPSTLTASILVQRALDNPTAITRSTTLEHLVRRMEYDSGTDRLLLDCQNFPANMCNVADPNMVTLSVSHPAPLCHLAFRKTQPKIVTLTRTGLLTSTDTQTQSISRTQICKDSVATAASTRNGEVLVLWTVAGERIVYSCSANRSISAQKYNEIPKYQSEIFSNSVWLELSESGSLLLCEVDRGKFLTREVGDFPGATKAGFVSNNNNIGIVLQESNDSSKLKITDQQGVTLATYDLAGRSVSFLQPTLGMILLSGQSGSELVRIIPNWSVVDSIPLKSAITDRNLASFETPEYAPLVSRAGITIWNFPQQVAEVHVPPQPQTERNSDYHAEITPVLLSANGKYIIWRDQSYFCIPRDIAKMAAGIVSRTLTDNERAQFKIKSRRDGI